MVSPIKADAAKATMANPAPGKDQGQVGSIVTLIDARPIIGISQFSSGFLDGRGGAASAGSGIEAIAEQVLDGQKKQDQNHQTRE